MSGTVTLSVYRIKDKLNDKPVTSFSDVIADPTELEAHDLNEGFEFEGRLFIAPSKSNTPPWREFLQPGFGSLDTVQDSVSSGAVLIARIHYDSEAIYFAIPFGFGRYLLKPDCFRWNYGLRVALNAMYPVAGPGNGYDAARIRSVDSKTVSSNVIYTRRQMARKAIFEDFGFNIQADQLKSLTGAPVDTRKWGSRLTGSSVFRVSPQITFSGLGQLLHTIEDTQRKKDYERQFGWVDDWLAVNDRPLITALDAIVLEQLQTRDPDARITLSPPHMVDWDQLDSFQYSFWKDKPFPDIELEDYLDSLAAKKKLKTLTLSQLRGGHRLFALDGAGEWLYRWALYRCLNAEVEHKGKTYLLDAGDYFEISPDFQADLNNYLAGLKESDVVLPDTLIKETEGIYNEAAAKSSPDYLLLDKKMVRVSTKTTPIEVCDILTSDRQMIHVKRKLASASLSHLFGQGYVSSDLLHTSLEYREAVVGAIDKAKAEIQPSVVTSDPGFDDRFAFVDLDGIQPSKFKVVYAIAAPWKGRDLVDALPFFSKVNLRRFGTDLQRMGFQVEYKRIEAT